MKTYAEVLTYAFPFFFGLIIIEYLISKRKGRKVLRSFDTVSSLSSGLTNTIKEVLGLGIVILSYDWMVDHLAVFHFKSSILLYVLAFIGLDFAGYWTHRFEHVVNVFWNRHIIHHSSEEYNLACALRQPVSNILGLFFFLSIPMAILGIPTKVIATLAPLHLFAQFWYHTRLIDKMGWLEKIIVTPSHHRVHHAINDIYLDKNFSQIFIVWDKIFGTFQEELSSEPPVYGVKRQVNTWNPFLINWQHFATLVKDAWHTKNLLDKIRVFFMPTGWRPKDREEADPIPYITDPKTQIKYETKASTPFHIWVWVQFAIHNLLMLYMFSIIGDFDYPKVLLLGIFLAVGIFSYTSLMDRSLLAIPAEILKILIAIWIFYLIGQWYDLDLFLPFGSILLGIYLVLSLVLTAYFLKKENIRFSY